MGVNGLIKRVLQEVGINPDRFSLQWASAAEAPRFVKLITEFTQKVREMGPVGDREGLSPEEVQQRIDHALKLVSDKKVRMAFGNVTRNLRKDVPNVDDKTIATIIDEKLSKSLAAG